MRVHHSLGLAAAAVLGLAAAGANAADLIFAEGFNTSGDVGTWQSGGSYGTILQVASGTSGIASYEGAGHAVATETDAGPYDSFGGVGGPGRTDFQVDMTHSMAIYLDTAWANGSGFDFSFAFNQANGNFLRDFIFHVTKDTSTGSLLVNGSNNTNFAPRQDLESLSGTATVASSGWYRFEHFAHDAGNGSLAVDLNVYAPDNSTLFTKTLNQPTDSIGNVGENRYAWFTTIVGPGLAVDGQSLTATPVPSPAAAGGGMAMLALIGLRRRRTV